MVMVATISGGEKLRFPIGREGVAMANEGGVKVTMAYFSPKTEKKLTYVFELTDTQKRGLRSVRVEDVSDEKPMLLVDNPEPKASATGQWHGEVELEHTDPRVAWLVTLSNSLRVYRFTLTFADGKTLVLHQGSLYPAALKSGIRHMFGQNY